jgi:hypothetical protein
MPKKDFPRIPRLYTGIPPHLKAIPKSERLLIQPARDAAFYKRRKWALRKRSIFDILSLLKNSSCVDDAK